MNKLRPGLLLASALLVQGTVACSDDATPSDPVDTGTDVEDTGGDDTTDVGADDAADTGDVVPTDGSSETDVLLGEPCTAQEDCPQGEWCSEGFCTVLTCGDPGDWTSCVEQLNAIEPDLGRYAICEDGRCDIACVVDTDCPAPQVCTDFGECRDFDYSFEDLPPAGDGTAKPFEAGFGESLWNYPIGVPAGGYGERAAGQDGQYALGLRASIGQVHGLYIRAAAFDDGVNPMIFVRLPAIFTGMELHEEVALALEERTGQDWRNNLVISSTHTHSGPCRHWHLPTEAATLLGSFGIGEFHQQFYDWIAESTLEAVNAALDDMEPARLAVEIVEGFDTFDRIGRDRWSATPQFDDNRLLLMRVDDMEGIPRGFLFSFAAHGTVNETDYLSGDVLEGAERQAAYALGEEYGRYIPTMFINQNSGSMSPAADVAGQDFPQNLEPFGVRFNEAAFDEFVAMETSSNVRMRSVNYRFPISYDLLGYERGELEGTTPLPTGGEYHYGGLSCVGPNGGDRDFSTYQDPEEMQCGGALQFLLFNRPATAFTRSQMTIGEITIDDDAPLTFVTLPGELAMELSWEVLRALRDEYDVDPLRSWTFGYANDHLLYVLPTNTRGERPPFPGLDLPHPENTGDDPVTGLPLRPGAPDDYPDFAFSLLQGAYESTMSPWGYRMGDYLVQRAVDGYALLDTPEAANTFDIPVVPPSRMSPIDMGQFTIEETAAADIAITTDIPATIERLQFAEIAWIGGSAGAEQPQTPLITLERQLDGGEFVTVTVPSTRDYNNHEPMFMTRLRLNEGRPEWVARWEEVQDFPTGTYRFRITGHHQEGGERKPYELFSTVFELTPSDDLTATCVATPTGFTGVYGYPGAEEMRFIERRIDRGAVEGNFRNRHPRVPSGAIVPIENHDGDIAVRLLGTDGEVVSTDSLTFAANIVEEGVNGRIAPQARYTLDLGEAPGVGTWTLEFVLADQYGNTGNTSCVVEVLPVEPAP